MQHRIFIYEKSSVVMIQTEAGCLTMSA